MRFLDVEHRAIQRGLPDRQAHGRVAHPLDGERGEQASETARADKHVLGRHLHPVEDHVS